MISAARRLLGWSLIWAGRRLVGAEVDPPAPPPVAPVVERTQHVGYTARAAEMRRPPAPPPSREPEEEMPLAGSLAAQRRAMRG